MCLLSFYFFTSFPMYIFAIFVIFLSLRYYTTHCTVIYYKYSFKICNNLCHRDISVVSSKSVGIIILNEIKKGINSNRSERYFKVLTRMHNDPFLQFDFNGENREESQRKNRVFFVFSRMFWTLPENILRQGEGCGGRGLRDEEEKEAKSLVFMF